jgi:hypothetical protein
MNTERFKNAAIMTLMEEIVKLHSAYKMVQIGMELKGCSPEEAEKILAEVIKETWEKCDIEFAKVETKTREVAKNNIDMLESIFGNMEV